MLLMDGKSLPMREILLHDPFILASLLFMEQEFPMEVKLKHKWGQADMVSHTGEFQRMRERFVLVALLKSVVEEEKFELNVFLVGATLSALFDSRVVWMAYFITTQSFSKQMASAECPG